MSLPCSAKKANGQNCKLRTKKINTSHNANLHPLCHIHLKSKEGLVVKKSSVHGDGLFTTRPIDEGEKVGEYACAKGAIPNSKANQKSDYLMELRDRKTESGDVFVVDADNPKTSSTMRYINDPRGSKKQENVDMAEETNKKG